MRDAPALGPRAVAGVELDGRATCRGCSLNVEHAALVGCLRRGRRDGVGAIGHGCGVRGGAAQLAQAERIEVLPTLVLYRDGKAVGSIVAPESKAMIETFIQEALAK